MTNGRIYHTDRTPGELGEVLTDYLRGRGFQSVVSNAGGNGVVVQARRTSPWHELLGIGRDLQVSITPGHGALSVQLREDQWQQKIPDASTAVAAFPPALLGAAYELWKRRRVDSELWHVIDQYTT